MVKEYAILRECITRLSARSGGPAIGSAELPLLHRAIDHAISISVGRFAEARERTLTLTAKLPRAKGADEGTKAEGAEAKPAEPKPAEAKTAEPAEGAGAPAAPKAQ